ncbi:MAG: helix-turn-helix domain-containing protein [Eubacteriales bacterium]
MIDFVKVGSKITKYRKEQNLTQDDIAEKLFVSRQLVSKWENGAGVPSIDVLLELCDLFQITFEELLCLNDEVYVDENDIFKGRNRLYIVQSVIDGKIKTDLSEVFYQFSPIERMMVLKAIKEGRLEENMNELYPKLTPGEQNFLRKENEI